MALKCAYAINHKLLRLHLDVMKRSNNDELMLELLAEIEGFSVRNLEAHKTADQFPPSPEGDEIEGDSGISRSEQEQTDYELAMKLQKEEREKCNNNNHSSNSVTKPDERRALPIISPPMAPPPDPTKTFGFFSGHYIKLKQRWDESIGVYINKGDISLAASPGNSESYSTQHSTEEDDEQFVDAVEEQSARSSISSLEEQSARSSISSLDSPTSPTSPEFDSPPDTVDLLYDDSPLSGSSPPPLGSPLPGGISFFDSPLSDITSTESSQSDPLIPENSLNSEDYLNHHVALKRNTVNHSRYEYSDSLSNTSSECTNNTSSECSNNTSSECTNNTSESTNNTSSECSNNISECANNTSSEYTNSSSEYTNTSPGSTNTSPGSTNTSAEITPDCTPSPTECSRDITSADDPAISSTDCSSDTASEVNDLPPVYYTGH